MKQLKKITNDSIEIFHYMNQLRNNRETKIIKRLVFFFLIAIILSPAKAQEYSYYTQYMFNSMAVNPAYASVHDFVGLSGNLREQWLGIEGAPSVQTISCFSPVFNNQFGLGVNIVNDRVGARSQQELSVNYAYKLKFQNYALSLGLKLGFNTINNSFDKLLLDDEDDVRFQDNSTAFLPIAGFGAYLKAKQYYIGFSIPQTYRYVSKKYNHLKRDQQSLVLLTGGYLFKINRDFKVRPNVFTKTQIGGVFEFDLNANVYYKEDYCVGITYKSLNTLAIIFEIGIGKMYYIGYSYDLATSKLINYQIGTHELSLNVYLNNNKNAKVVNPRYF